LLCVGVGDVERQALSEFFKSWPSVESALGATWQQVHRRLELYGIAPDTAKTLLRFCGECVCVRVCVQHMA